MTLSFHFGSDVILLPREILCHFEKVTKKDLRVLLSLAADPMARVDYAAAVSAVAGDLGITTSEVENAVAFWRGTGLLSLSEEQATSTPAPAAPAAAPAKPAVDRGLPSYTTEELSGVLERRHELALLIDACQQTFGKIFNTAEINIIVGLVDYLGVDGDYVLLLLSHCVRMEKKSLRYAEKMALSLYDEGVDNANALAERLHRIELMADAVGKIRTMFGISSRALTTKEKGFIEKWICTMKYSDEILQKAFEITVDSIGKASIPYTNTILERWFAEGYRTLEDIDRAIAEYSRKKTDQGSSFDVDDFFEAALKRTYGAT